MCPPPAKLGFGATGSKQAWLKSSEMMIVDASAPRKITSSHGHLPCDFAFTFLWSPLLTGAPWLQHPSLWAQYAPEACKGVFDSLLLVNRITGLKTMFPDTGGSGNHTHCAQGSTTLSGPMSTHSYWGGNWQEGWISRWFCLVGGLVTLQLLTLLPRSAPGSFLCPCCPLERSAPVLTQGGITAQHKSFAHVHPDYLPQDSHVSSASSWRWGLSSHQDAHTS